MNCDSALIVCGLLDKSIVVFDRKSFKCKFELLGHTDHIWSIDLNEGFIVSGSWDASAKIWSRAKGGVLEHEFRFPDGREVSQVKIKDSNEDGCKVFVASLGGVIAILKERSGGRGFETETTIPAKSDLGEIYSMTLDDSLLLTSHSRNMTMLQVWLLGPNHTSTKATTALIQDSRHSGESIIWSITLDFPLAFLCHDNETLDVYHLESKSCLKSLQHGQAKVLNAQAIVSEFSR